MLGAFRSAHAGPRSAAARIGLAALLACIGLTWTAGASSAFATYGTVSITKKNVGGDSTDVFHFDSSSAIKVGGFDLIGGGTYTNTKVEYNTAKSYAGKYTKAAYTVSEPASDKYELQSIDCSVSPSYHKGSASTSLATRSVAIRVGVGEKVDCTFTNQRKTGTITVKKQLEPATDSGKFDLQVDGKDVAQQVGNGGYGSLTVPTGTHTVGEYGANLGDYVRYTKCLKGTTVVAEGSGVVNVPVGAYDEITCTIKNVRKAQVVVEKKTAPADTAATKTAFDFSMTPGAVAYSLTDGQADTRSVEPGKAYTVAEADSHAKGYRLTAIDCTSGTTNVDTRTATFTPAAGETVKCVFTNTKLQPGIRIVKSGPATAYSGDTLQFGFDVTNTGERALHEVDVTDDHCAPVTKADALQDSVLDPGETWHYTCSYVATNTLHVDPNPVTNIAHVQARDDQDTKVEDEDTHDTLFLHPAIDIEKSGPATATAGALLTYTLDVTNPGDMPFAAADVAVTDAKCKATPALQSSNGDATPDVLDPGDRWTYTCQVQTAAGQTSVVNVADARGTDENGKVVTDEDTFTTTLTQPQPPSNPQPPVVPPVTPTVTPQATAPAQQVAGVTARAARGTAALRGPRACPRTTSVAATVTGRQIRRVTFFVRGKRVKTVTKADRNGRWTLKVRTSSLRRGANAVVARVQFTAASGTKTRSLRITVTRCAARAVQPQFTG
jgi:hypothetical protein